jgi:hypothetical protein
MVSIALIRKIALTKINYSKAHPEALKLKIALRKIESR